MLGLHAANAVLLIAVNVLAAGWGAFYLRRKTMPGRLYAHALALGQSLVIAQVALGAVLSPWLYAPPVPARRLLWFTGAALVGSALAVRAYTTS
jgi:uncharacterized membrane protein YedE/YeeE